MLIMVILFYAKLDLTYEFDSHFLEKMLENHFIMKDGLDLSKIEAILNISHLSSSYECLLF